jgi:hypothetical protein
MIISLIQVFNLKMKYQHQQLQQMQLQQMQLQQLQLKPRKTPVNQAQAIQLQRNQLKNKINHGGVGDHHFKSNPRIQLYLLFITQLVLWTQLLLLLRTQLYLLFITQLVLWTQLLLLLRTLQAQIILPLMTHPMTNHPLMIQLLMIPDQMMKIGTMTMKKMIL